jgi:O-6-methylguanine DNA methyltransferase
MNPVKNAVRKRPAVIDAGIDVALCHVKSPVGTLHVGMLDGAICWIGFDTAHWRASMERYLRRAWRVVRLHEVEASKAIEREIAIALGTRKGEPGCELVFHGTPFQEAVWKAVLQIPRGTTVSYADIARSIGNPKAVRAVGTAIGGNPIPIIIPCHRVIAKDGGLGGFGGGLRLKKQLLQMDGIEL